MGVSVSPSRRIVALMRVAAAVVEPAIKTARSFAVQWPEWIRACRSNTSARESVLGGPRSVRMAQSRSRL